MTRNIKERGGREKIVLHSAFLLTAILISNFDQAEEYNFYLWNRENALKKNGKVDRGDWFEWWYTKVVDPQSREAFFFVYGIVNPWDENQSRQASRSYIHFGNISKSEKFLIEEKWNVREFSGDYDRTRVQIADQFAMTDQSLKGSLSNSRAKWNLKMKKNWSFNAMGWGLFHSWISNIFWYPAQASATMDGEIELSDRKIKIENLPAYQDRNWGRGFPKWWAWIVSNSFEGSPHTSLAIGGGKPKTFQKIFLMSGLSIAFHHEGHDYIFRTTDADKVKFQIKFGKWEISAENDHHERLEVSAFAAEEDFILIPFVSPRGETFYDYEALMGQVKVSLFKRKNLLSRWEKKAELVSNEAGIEFGSGNPEIFDTKTILILE